MRAAETPDAAPVDLPAAKADLPPSYPPPRRSRRARARSGSSPRRRRRWIPHRSTILVVVIVVALTALFKTFVIQWFEIPSGSMENTLEVGDEVAVTMYDAQDLERGDVVVFTDPDHWLDVEDPTGLRGVIRDTLILIHLLPENTGHYLIKRVIGVAGDHIVADGRGSLTVNGVPVNETYLKPGRSASEMAFDVVVPRGFVWVMGDNRSNSSDSRYHQDDAHGGFVPIDDVAGVAKVVVWPIGHWRGLGDGHEAFKDVPEPGRAPAPAAPAPEDGA
nr:signal peptidase I [Actinomyces dentalis]